MDCNNNYEPVNGATQQTFNPATSSGFYAVIIRDGVCSDTSSCHEVISVGNIENSENDFLNISPNPTSGSLGIETFFKTNGIIQIDVLNTIGQCVYSISEKTNKGLYRKNLELEISSGLYFLVLQTSEGKWTKKIEVK